MNLRRIIREEMEDMQWMMDIDIPQVGDTYKYLVQKVPKIRTAEFVITKIIPTPWTQSKYVIKYRIQGNTEKYDYEIYLDDFLTGVEEGLFVKIKEINESDDMQWIKDIPAGIEIGACYKYDVMDAITQTVTGNVLVNQPLVIEKIQAHVPSSEHEHPKYYYDKEVSSIEELTTADYEKTWVYLRNQETGYRNFLGVNEMVNKLEDGVLIPC